MKLFRNILTKRDYIYFVDDAGKTIKVYDGDYLNYSLRIDVEHPSTVEGHLIVNIKLQFKDNSLWYIVGDKI